MFLQHLTSKANQKLKSLCLLSSRSLTIKTNKPQSKLGLTFNQIPSSSYTAASSSPYSQETQTNKLKSSFNQLSKLIPFTSAYKSTTMVENGLFGKKDLGSFEGFYKLKQDAESKVRDLIKEALEPETVNKRRLVEIFDDISNELCCVADLAEFVRTSHPDINYRQAADLTFGQISQIVEKLNTNSELYIKLKESNDPNSPSFNKLDDCDKRVCNLFLADFEQSGIHLDTVTRNKFVSLNDQLVNILMKFQINSQTPSTLNTNEIDSKFKSV